MPTYLTFISLTLIHLDINFKKIGMIIFEKILVVVNDITVEIYISWKEMKWKKEKSKNEDIV